MRHLAYRHLAGRGTASGKEASVSFYGVSPGSPQVTVVENVAVEASENIAKPQHSAVPIQAIQSKSFNRIGFL
jgi:hypothetical protein